MDTVSAAYSEGACFVMVPPLPTDVIRLVSADGGGGGRWYGGGWEGIRIPLSTIHFLQPLHVPAPEVPGWYTRYHGSANTTARSPEYIHLAISLGKEDPGEPTIYSNHI